MDLTTAAKLLKVEPPRMNVKWEGVSIDSRVIAPGELFVALTGEHFDGHNFISDVEQKGATALIVSRPVQSNLPTLLVEDTRLALGQLAAHHRQQFQIPILALTGSVGKTTVKEMTAAILNQQGKTIANYANYNNDIGLPISLLKLRTEHQFGVFELGTNHIGELPYLSNIVKPDIALITNIAPTHLAGFESIDNIAKEKSAIYRDLRPNGIAVVNIDDEYAKTWFELITQSCLTYGLQNKADVTAKVIQVDEEFHSHILLSTPFGEIEIRLGLPGQHQVMNALAASTMACAAKIPLSAIKLGLETMAPVIGRQRMCRGLAGSRVIDDTYNANPRGVKAALDMLANFAGRRIFVFGGMKELGEKAEYYHQEVGQYAAKLGIDAVYCCGEFCHLTCEAFGKNAQLFPDHTSIIARLQQELSSDVTCLIKGARSAKMEQTILPALLGNAC